MRWNELESEPCSVARSLAVIGDRWSLLILRDCFLGIRRFESFQARLQISRTILRDRLNHLVEYGVLERRQYEDKPPRHEYRLTDSGKALHPVMLAIVHWGDTYMRGADGPPLIHTHTACGRDFVPVTTCSECGEPVAPREVAVRAGPGAGPDDDNPSSLPVGHQSA